MNVVEIQKFSAASEIPVLLGLVRCSNRISNGAWLDGGNNFGSPSQSINIGTTTFTDASDYAASCSILHCADAWSFLGRACSAIASGSVTEAIHLVYYSELRSAISILASAGILNRGNESFILSPQKVEKISLAGTTHTQVWELFDAWITLGSGTNAIAGLINVAGHSLTTWMAGRINSGNTPTSTLAPFLKEWSLDLKTLIADRNTRNLASYRPGNLNLLPPHLDGDQICKLLSEICELLEPDSKGTFPTLDFELFVSVISRPGVLSAQQQESTAGSQSPPPPSANSISNPVELRKKLIDDILGKNSGSSGFASRVEANVASRNAIILAASKPSSVGLPISFADLQGMLGRAIILARIATGRGSFLFTDSGVATNKFDAWADKIGSESGYWDISSKPKDLISLWRDIADARDDIDNYGTDSVGSEVKPMHATLAASLLAVTGLSRSALWNFL